MSRTLKIVFTFTLLFVIGVRKVKPLKCFVCTFTEIDDKAVLGSKGCRDLTSSDTEFLTTCPSLTKQSCGYAKLTGSTDGGKVNLWARSCKEYEESGCETKSETVSGVTAEGNFCFCQTDGCNKSSGLTYSFTLLTLCWALMSAIHHLV